MKSHSPFVPRWLPVEALEARVVLSADLVIDVVTAPAASELGTEIEVSWVVRNAGDAATSGEFGWTDGLYLSADDVLDANDLYLGEYFAERSSPLAPGETYTTTAAVWLPVDALLGTGQYRLIVAADVGDWEAEGDEDNNGTVSGAMGVSVPLLPDLTVSEVTASELGQFGESFSISWTITNTGPGSTFIEWTDGLYLSTDDLLDASDQWVEIVDYTMPTAPLAPGESVTIQATARLPFDGSLPVGSYRLIVVADGYSEQAEGNEENNALASAAIEIAAAAPADLIVEDVVSVTSGEFGEVVTLTWTIRNTGEGSAMWWGDDIYLSADAILDGADVSLTSVDGSGASGTPLAPGESIQMQATVRLPGGGAASAGGYRLLVQADAWGSVAESDETNNTGASAELTIGTPTPADLVVDSGLAPATGELGQVIEVTWVVRNQGAGSASTWGWTDGVFLSLDGVLGGDDIQLGWADPAWQNVLSLAAGESLNGGTQIWLPQDGSILPGTYQIIIAADVNSQVFDADPNNNTLIIATIEITGQVLGPPEFNPELGGGWGFPSMGAAPDGGFLRSNTADGLGTVAVATVDSTGGQAQAGTNQVGELATLLGASDLGTGLFTFADRAGGQQAGRGLSKINLRVGSEAGTPVVRSSFVQ